MKVIAMYLPQYHKIKENDVWWGEGYTEWTAVKNAKPYSKKQNQPRIPMDQNYYDLSDETGVVWDWQAKLAREYNVYGFAIYHYWFSKDRQLLERPMEILLKHPEIDINYCVCWANESWRKAWYGTQNELLMEQYYGEKSEWICHFNYLLPFFKDTRYIKINNKPLVNIYHSAEVECLKEMLEIWKQLAVENGFDGIYVVSGNTGAVIDTRSWLFDAYYNFEPSYTLMHKRKKTERIGYIIDVSARSIWNKIVRRKILERPINGRNFLSQMMREDIIRDKKIYPGAFPQWDNSPRRKYKGTFFYNMDKDTFKKQIRALKKKYVNSEFMYINAWNEWGEGTYLEPDETNRYSFLEVIRDEFADEDAWNKRFFKK